METLTLKEILPYLPYSLDVFITKDKIYGELSGIDSDRSIIQIGNNEWFKVHTKDIQPMLKKIKVIEQDDDFWKEFYAEFGGGYKNLTSFKNEWLSSFQNNPPTSFSYDIMQMLFKYHYDVFSLIEKKLAIEKPFVSNLEEGLFYAPYVLMEHTEESLKKHESFMDEYYKKHELCPNCGHKGHTTTLIGYPLIVGEEENYQDKNICVCTNCGDRHITHDRISKEEFLKKQN